MSLQKPKAVHAASKRQYIASVGEVQVPWFWIGFHEWRQNKEIDTRIGKANAVLREFCRSLVSKRELSNTAKLSFQIYFVFILIYDHESWVTTEWVWSQVQAAEMAFLWRVHGVTVHRKVRVSRTMRGWRKPWGISIPPRPRASAQATLPEKKRVWKWMNEFTQIQVELPDGQKG